MFTVKQDIGTRLKSADRKYQRELAWAILSKSIKYICLVVFLLVGLDIVLHLSSQWRLTLSLGFIALLISFSLILFYFIFIRSYNDERVARILESKSAALGSSLINILQLKKQTEDKTIHPLTQTLAKQAIEDATKEVEKIGFNQLVVSPERQKNLYLALGALSLFIFLLLAFATISKLELLRYIDPFGDHPPFSLTKLSITTPAQDDHQVIYGEGTLIEVGVMGHMPEEVFLTFYSASAPEKKTTLPMFNKGSIGFSQRIENIKSDLIVYVHTTDERSVSKNRRIKVLLTPQLKAATIEIISPEYTKIKKTIQPYQFKTTKILQGSKIRYTLQSNRPLKTSEMIYQKGLPSQKSFDMPVLDKEKDSVSVLFQPDENGSVEFQIFDVSGIPSKEPLKGSVTLTYDLKPNISIDYPENNSFVTQDFKLEAIIRASDDYGIKYLRLHRGLNGVYSQPKIISYEDSPRGVEEHIPFNFTELGVSEGDVISFYAEVYDTFPVEPHMASSDVIHLIVVSVEAYNDFLRERTSIEDIEGKYKKLFDRLQEAINEQKELNKQIEKLQKEMAAKVAKGDNTGLESLKEKMQELIAKQSEVNAKLGKISEELKEFGRDKPLYDIEDEFKELLKEHAAKIDEVIKQSEKALKSFDNDVNNGKPSMKLGLEALERLSEAGKETVKKLDKEKEELDEEVVETIQDIALLQKLIRDLNDFKILYEIQESIALKMQAYDSMRMLSKEDSLAMKNTARDQRLVAKELKTLVENLYADAEKAKEHFPKASQGAIDLAKAIEELQLSDIAEKATNAMLIPDGKNSYRLAERLRLDMLSLFNDPSNCNGGMCKGSLDSYLQLMLAMEGKNTFKQMCQSLKTGLGFGNGSMGGSGTGVAGTGSSGGYSQGTSPKMGVLGNENFQNTGDSSGRKNSQANKGGGRATDADSDELELSYSKERSQKGARNNSQKTKSTTSQTVYEKYSEVIDAYFKNLTK